MSGVYCYVERGDGGTAVTGLRLVDAREQRVWAAPAASPAAPEAARDSIVAAAAWIAQQLGEAGAREGVTVCLDLDGARCAWLTAPSNSRAVVHAAVRSAALSGTLTDAEAGGVGGGGAGVGSLWASEFGQLGQDLSVEGLDPAREAGSRPVLGAGKGGNGKVRELASRQRLAVLAVPDLAARVLLDELDARGVNVDAVTSLWHAAAAAWDPARSAELAAGRLSRSSPGEGDDAGMIDGSAPTTAVVLIDPRGKLAWSWSRDGVLTAAGAHRLRRSTVAVAGERGASLSPLDADGNGSALLATAPPPSESASAGGPGDGPLSVVEVTRAEVGRIVGEWLAWSAQLGAAPARIVVLGPTGVTCAGLARDLPEVSGVGAVGDALARAWPGASAGGAIEDDPVRATLTRLAGASDGRGLPAGAERRNGGDDAGTSAVLGELSARPGRAWRSTYFWTAAAVLAAAVGVGALAYKIDRGAAETERMAGAAVARRVGALEEVRTIAPRALTALDPIRELKAQTTRLRRDQVEATPERPILGALERVLRALEGVPGVTMGEFRADSREVRFQLGAQNPEDLNGAPRVIEALRDSAEQPRLNWDGGFKDVAGRRIYTITGGWPSATSGGAGANPARNARPAAPLPAPTPATPAAPTGRPA